jgi:hypothetical protein
LNDYSDMATQLGIRVPPLMMGDNDMYDAPQNLDS